MVPQTADLCDDFSDVLAIAAPVFRDFGGKKAFAGEIVTLRTFEDNTFVRETLEQAGHGRVLVVDGGGSMRCALLGDKLAELGVKNGWSGLIINGCIRDSAAVAGMDLGVKALGTHPLKSRKLNYGELNVDVTFAGVMFRSGEYVYADADGVVVAPRRLR